MRFAALAPASALLLIGALSSGCPDPELGTVPFFCNPGQPQCPEGYVCRGDRCIKEGAQPPADLGAPDLPLADAPAFPDGPQLFPDQRRPDAATVKWDGQRDLLPVPDKGTSPDGWPPHLGCQSHTECQQAGSDAPCCCPFLMGVWTCLPLCLNPLCL